VVAGVTMHREGQQGKTPNKKDQNPKSRVGLPVGIATFTSRRLTDI